MMKSVSLNKDNIQILDRMLKLAKLCFRYITTDLHFFNHL